MGTSAYIAIGAIIFIIALGFFSTIRFNRKKPMTKEEYEKHEAKKKALADTDGKEEPRQDQ